MAKKSSIAIFIAATSALAITTVDTDAVKSGESDLGNYSILFYKAMKALFNIFNYYISNFAEYNKVYGSIGTLIIILLWMYINSIILLIGFELNARIFNAKKQKKL